MPFISTQPYKGTRDFYPTEMRFRKWMFEKLRSTVELFGYEEYDGPMLEPFDLYAAKTGEEIVNQQLYWLMDRGERKLAIRPEMTPTLARMVAGKLQELPKPVRWYSIPNLWRYERPQRGRLREHWQLNVDVLGGDPLLADAEVIQLASRLMETFGGEEHVSIRVSHRALADHFFTEKLGLGSEQAIAVIKLVDAKNKLGEKVFQEKLSEAGLGASHARALEEFFSLSLERMSERHPCSATESLSRLFELLAESEVSNVVFDPSVMRGMDYYTGTVFEIYDTSPENNRAMFGGGRYDNLLGLFGKDKLSGMGFGMGDVTLQNFLETHGLVPEEAISAADVFVAMPGEAERRVTERLAERLREAGIKVMTPLSAEGFAVQLKQATKHGARVAVLLGEEELKQGKVLVKDLRAREQVVCAERELIQTVEKILQQGGGEG